MECKKLSEEVVAYIDALPLALTAETDPDLRLVHGNPTQLHQILMNLCVNARDAMPDGGLLKISSENLTVEEGGWRDVPKRLARDEDESVHAELGEARSDG